MSSFICIAQIDYGLYIRHQQLGQYDASYQFFYSDGKFSYCTDMYNDLTGQVCISGSFYINGDSIFFYDISLEIPLLSDLTRVSPIDRGKERIKLDSSIIMRNRPTNSNYWSLVGNGSRKKIKLDAQERFSATFFRHENDEYIEIDGEKFYGESGPSD